ncbi:MAG: hypothetical protein ACR2PJ_08185 [Pseudomonadales bacterium]
MEGVGHEKLSVSLQAVDLEVTLTNEKESNPPGDIEEARGRLTEEINMIARDGSIEEKLTLERRVLTAELERPNNLREKEASYQAAVLHLDHATEMIDRLQNNPDDYLITDRDHSMDADRRNGLPYDKGAKFFSSHITRLRNMSKVRMSESDSKLIQARIYAMKEAQKMYTALQKKALGIKETKS